MRTLLRFGLLVSLAAAVGCGDGTVQSRSGGPSPSRAGVTAAESGWRAISASPLSPRHSSLAVPLGSSVLFLGGQDEAMCPPNADCAIAPHRLRDGASYTPATDTWRRVAPAPVGISLGSPTAVIGDVVYVLDPPTDSSGDPAVHAYDVSADRWSTLPSPTGPYVGIVAAGTHLVAYVTSHEHGPRRPDEVFDFAQRRWEALPLDPLEPSFDRTFVWAGDRLAMLAPKLVPQPGGADGPSWLRAATLDLRTRTWTALPETRQVISGELMPVWTGTHVLNASPGGADGGATNNYGRVLPFGGYLDVTTGRWTSLPDGPSEDTRYRGWGTAAASPAYTAAGSVVYDAQARSWVPLPAPPDDDVQGFTSAWVRDRLVVWGGARISGDAPAQLVSSGAAWTAP